MDLIEAICIAGIGLAAAGTTLLFARRPRRATTLSMALISACMGLFLTAALGLYSRWSTFVLLVPYTILPLGWFFGPLVFAHTELSLFTTHWLRLMKRLSFVLIPFVLELTRATVNPLIWPEFGDPRQVFEHEGVIGLQTRIAWSVFLIWTLAFALASMRRLRIYHRFYPERYSTRKSGDARSQKILIWSVLAWLLLLGAQPILAAIYPASGALPFMSLVAVPTILLIYLLLHQVFNQGRPPRIKRTAEQKRSGASRLTNEQQTRLADALERLLEQDVHLDEDLRIGDLAAELSTTIHHLSEVINQRFGTNFYGLINRYRVRSVSRFLADPARREDSILDLAFEAGFNSKASFNRIFKGETGQTPSAYRREKLKSGSQSSA